MQSRAHKKKGFYIAHQALQLCLNSLCYFFVLNCDCCLLFCFGLFYCLQSNGELTSLRKFMFFLLPFLLLLLLLFSFAFFFKEEEGGGGKRKEEQTKKFERSKKEIRRGRRRKIKILKQRRGRRIKRTFSPNLGIANALGFFLLEFAIKMRKMH